MAHEHQHEGEAFYKDQLSTIALCGLLGGVCVMLWQQGKLGFLAPNFQLPVLLGGLTLLGLVGVRAVLVWMSAGAPAAAACHDDCGHEHDHGHDHAHSHDHDHTHDHAHPHDHAHGHDHGHHHHDDHGHDHGWSPWRYAILLLPIMLFFLNLPPAPILTVRAIAAGPPAKLDKPSEGSLPAVEGTVKSLDTQAYTITVGDETYSLDTGVKVSVDGQNRPLAAIVPGMHVSLTLTKKYSNLSAEYIIRQLQNRQLEDTGLDASVVNRGEGIESLSFPVVERAALYPDLRQALEGKMGRLRGQFMSGPSDRVASLVRIKMTCCLADVRPLEVVLIAPESLARFKPYDWVEVTGQIQFRKRKNRDAYLPVLQLQSPEQIQPTDPEPDFLY